MEKTSTHAWTFENSSCCATWLVLSWLIPCWGLCLPSLAVATGFRQLVLALTVTTKNNPTHFLCLPTESYPSTSSSLVALDMWGHVLVGARPPIYVETYLCVLLLWVYLSLDHFFHPVDCEAVGMLGAIPAKGQARGRNERCQLGWTGLGWGGLRSLWNCGLTVFLPEASPCLKPNIWCQSISRDISYSCLNELDVCNPWLALDGEKTWQWLATLGQLSFGERWMWCNSLKSQRCESQARFKLNMGFELSA